MFKPTLLIFIFIVLASVLLNGSACRKLQIREVRLEKISYDRNDRIGWSNIFLRESAGDFQIPETWENVKADLLVNNQEYEKVYILSFEENGLQYYAVDLNSDWIFEQSEILDIEDHDDSKYADFTVTLKDSESKESVMTIDYQLLLSEYQYARINEYHRGLFKNHRIELHHRNRNNPLYDMSRSTILNLDFNDDGKINRTLTIDENGVIQDIEEVGLSNPFYLDQDKYIVTSIDPEGEVIAIQETSADTAAVKKFIAPDLKFTDLEHKSFTLGSMKGKEVLIIFWSIYCYFSERIRPDLNAWIENHKDKDIEFLAVPIKETDTEKIKTFLNEHPYHARVVTVGREDLKRYNPSVISPMYYLIDEQGIVEFKAIGGSSFEIFAAYLEGMNPLKEVGPS